MELINREEVAKLTNLRGLPAEGVTSMLMSTLKINKINRIYSKIYHSRSTEFIDNVLNELGINFEIDDEDLKKIPKSGAFITISNHPYGGIDGILLLKLLSETRDDFKVMANFMLKKIEPVKDKILPINPFENHKDKASNINGVKQTLLHLSQGHPVGIFPAGEVSSFNGGNKITDKTWIPAAIKFIKKAEVPVVPIYFHGGNSLLFHLLGIINPLLRTARLPAEMLKKNKTIRIRVGSPISVQQQKEFKNQAQFGRYLRARTYALGTSLKVNNYFKRTVKIKGKPEKIVEPQNTEVINQEIEQLNESYMLFTNSNYKVFCAPPERIPRVLNEIGRLREITFREVGEGTNRSIDLDEYDLYYEHLFIWDTNAKKIVGAYRVGKGQEIMEKYGKKGLYITSLFKFKKELNPVLKQSIELGRSFITSEYQRKREPLFLLWKGILHVLLKNTEYRYLIGPVSISNNFSKFSKSLLIDFIRKNYFHDEYSQYVKPRKAFKVDYENIDYLSILHSTNGDIAKLDRIIEDIEPSHFKIPVLVKKYLKQNAKILEFNVDARFNMSLDGLILLDLHDIPLNSIQLLTKEMEKEAVYKKIYSNIMSSGQA